MTTFTVTSRLLSLIAVRSELVIAARLKLMTTGAASSFDFSDEVMTTTDFGTTKYFMT